MQAELEVLRAAASEGDRERAAAAAQGASRGPGANGDKDAAEKARPAAVSCPSRGEELRM